MINRKKLNILIVEDEALIAEDIKDICELAGNLVSKICYDAHQAILAITNSTFDLAILDINLESELTGLDIAEFIGTQNIQLPYIFLTSYSDHATLDKARECKPIAYITKPFRKEQLISSIEINFKTRTNTESFVSANKENLAIQLTDREKEISQMICDGKSNEEIASKLYLSVNTVKFHVKNLYEKFDVNNRVQLTRLLIHK